MRGVRLALGHDEGALVERYIEGMEVTVGILDGAALPVGEIIAAGEVFDYQSKYQVDGAREIFPADLPAAESTQLQDYATGGGNPRLRAASITIWLTVIELR